MPILEELQRLTPERFLAIYESLAQGGFGPMDTQVAQELKFRPQAIRKLPLAKRASRARMILQRNGNVELAYDLLGNYLLHSRRELVTDFLDATGVPHEEGMLEDTDDYPPDESKVEAAVAELDGKFDPEDVTLYLSLCAEQWPDCAKICETWTARSSG